MLPSAFSFGCESGSSSLGDSKALVALRYEDKFRQEAEENQKAAAKLDTEKNANDRRTDSRLGELVGLSRDTIAKTRKLATEADEEMKARLASGDISINKAIQSLKEPASKKTDEHPRKLQKPLRFRRNKGPLTSMYTNSLKELLTNDGEVFEQWGDALKSEVADRKLRSHEPHPDAEKYAFGNTIMVIGKGMEGCKDTDNNLSEAEKAVVSDVDALLKQLNTGLRDALDTLIPFSVHRDLFVVLVERLRDAFISGTADIFTYLNDLEVVNTLRFGAETESGNSHDEMMQEEREKKGE